MNDKIDKIDPAEFDPEIRDVPSVHLPTLLQVRPDTTVNALADGLRDTLNDARVLSLTREFEPEPPGLIDSCVLQRLDLAGMLFDELAERGTFKPQLRSVP